MENNVFSDTGISQGVSNPFTDTGITNENVAENFLGEHDADEIITIHGEIQDYVFAITEKNSKGGGKQARVYVCQGSATHQRLAIKIYNISEIIMEKLVPTLDFLKNHKHMNISNVLEHGTCYIDEKEYYYAVMDLYEGLDRASYVWKNNDDEEYRGKILTFVDEINEALRFIHKHKVFHGDIKPDNIMFDPKTNKIVLIDFGASAKAIDPTQTSVAAAGGTPYYAAPEILRNGQINTYSEYYSVGVSLAELIDGVLPGKENDVVRRFKETKSIRSFFVPHNLPDYYENLLKGLLYEDDDTARRREHRWIANKVDTWLADVRSYAYDKAATRNQVPTGMVEQKKFSEWDFGNHLTLEVGEDEVPYTFNSLTEMADAFLDVNVWDDAINVLLDGDSFSENNVKSDILRLITKGAERMQNVNSSNGQSINAEFFKFMFKYVSDKKRFVWKDLPQVESMEDLALYLREDLLEKQKNGGYYGKWWEYASERTKSISTIFAEIFRNKVLSFYLKRTDYPNKAVIEQCEKVEKIFMELKERYSDAEITELFLFQRMLLNQTTYEILNGEMYESLDEFTEDLRSKAYDPNRVKEANVILNSVKGEKGYYPDFVAWKKLCEL